MRADAVIFDLWGTLADTFSEESHRRLMADMAASVGVDADTFGRGWTESYEDRMRGGSVEEHVRRLVGDGSDVSAAVRLRLGHINSSLRFRPDVVPTLRELRRRRLRTGLISICSSEVEAAVAAGELAPLLDVAVYSCSEDVTKPDPEVFRLTAGRLGVAATACVFVDDTVENLFGAEEAGMRAVQIGDRPGWDGARVERVGEVLELVGGAAA
jgi:putative hydrolase of the HAD superfamily